ncbi:hypothetical protein [Vibrio owensii]|uniref:Uncharacterized protein n=1 Tax=Vibrio owensii CAIM 1854 = LMG 25443 TaxID=1229493 RepID=A0A0C1VT09_9VIBR|nr:hypothetical protein [Vibrio owensii]KIF53053.1 hypothetical protein H735_08880 [Vibrio owensii CAIM 1854 = LMG 25443]
MSLKLAHRRKINAKKFGTRLIRRVRTVINCSEWSPFNTLKLEPQKSSRAGKNKIVTCHDMVLIACPSGTGKSFLTDEGNILNKLASQDEQDDGDRVESFMREIESRSKPTEHIE